MDQSLPCGHLLSLAVLTVELVSLQHQLFLTELLNAAIERGVSVNVQA